jgi:hypothetical protein
MVDELGPGSILNVSFPLAQRGEPSACCRGDTNAPDLGFSHRTASPDPRRRPEPSRRRLPGGCFCGGLVRFGNAR